MRLRRLRAHASPRVPRRAARAQLRPLPPLGSVALNPIGYALIGPVAAAIGTAETLVIAGILDVLVCLSVLLVPSVRGIRTDGPVAVEAETGAA